MNPTLTIVHKTKKTNKLYYTGDDPNCLESEQLASRHKEIWLRRLSATKLDKENKGDGKQERKKEVSKEIRPNFD